MNEFEKWYSKQPISERSCQEAFKAGLFCAANIVTNYTSSYDMANDALEYVEELICLEIEKL